MMNSLQKYIQYNVRHIVSSAKQLYLFFFAFVKLPPAGIKAYFSYKLGLLNDPSESFRINVGNNLCLNLRKNMTDIMIFEQIFLLEDCAVPVKDFQPRFIIDGGAHIGCATIYFALKYPQAKIMAIEAESSNFRQLCENVRELPHVEAIHAAIYSQEGYMTLQNPKDDGWGFCVKPLETDSEQGGQKIPAVTIQDLIRRSDCQYVDLLKLDIEGTEYDVFTSHPEKWLPLVHIINIELHDRFRPGCSEVFFAAVSGYPAVVKKTIHNLVWIKDKAF